MAAVGHLHRSALGPALTSVVAAYITLEPLRGPALGAAFLSLEAAVGAPLLALDPAFGATLGALDASFLAVLDLLPAPASLRLALHATHPVVSAAPAFGAIAPPAAAIVVAAAAAIIAAAALFAATIAAVAATLAAAFTLVCRDGRGERHAGRAGQKEQNTHARLLY